MKAFLAAVFKNPTGNWDLGRIMGFKSITAFNVSFLWAVFKLHTVPDWSALGVGLAAVMAGAGALIGMKDLGVAKANSVTPPTSPAQ